MKIGMPIIAAALVLFSSQMSAKAAVNKPVTPSANLNQKIVRYLQEQIPAGILRGITAQDESCTVNVLHDVNRGRISLTVLRPSIDLKSNGTFVNDPIDFDLAINKKFYRIQRFEPLAEVLSVDVERHALVGPESNVMSLQVEHDENNTIIAINIKKSQAGQVKSISCRMVK